MKTTASILPVAIEALRFPGSSRRSPCRDRRSATHGHRQQEGRQHVDLRNIQEPDQAQTPQAEHAGRDRREHDDRDADVLEVERPGNAATVGEAGVKQRKAEYETDRHGQPQVEWRLKSRRSWRAVRSYPLFSHKPGSHPAAGKNAHQEYPGTYRKLGTADQPLAAGATACEARREAGQNTACTVRGQGDRQQSCAAHARLRNGARRLARRQRSCRPADRP